MARIRRHHQPSLAALSAVLLLSFLAVQSALGETLPEDLNRQNVLQHLRDRDITTVEGLVDSLPTLHKAHSVLVFKSQALGADFISSQNPRVISYGADSRFVLSWVTDPNSPFYEKVEFLEPVRDNWAAGIIDFSATAPVIRYPPICSSCHGQLNKPLWGHTPSFPGTEGERLDDSRADDGLDRISDDAASVLRHARSSTDPRLTPLGLQRTIPTTTPTHTRTSLVTPIPLVDDLGITLGWRHIEVLFHKTFLEGNLNAAQTALCESSFYPSYGHTVFPYMDDRYRQDKSLSARGDTGAFLEGIKRQHYENQVYHNIEEGF